MLPLVLRPSTLGLPQNRLQSRKVKIGKGVKITKREDLRMITDFFCTAVKAIKK